MPDMDTDPIAWFQKNQIKSDADFQARKEALRAEAKKRLDFVSSRSAAAPHTKNPHGSHACRKYCATQNDWSCHVFHCATQIMDKKNQRLMWPSDSEFDDMSISR